MDRSIRSRVRRSGALACLAAILSASVVAHAFQLGSRPAAEWIPGLESPQRVSTLKIDAVVAGLNLKPGMVVADIGSGTGLLSRPIAKAVAPGGKVYAVDIDRELLAYVDLRAKEAKIKNIEPHLAVADDALLPGPVVDLALFHDALHHIAHRDVYLKNLAKYMKPGSRIAVVENDVIADPNSTHHDFPEMLITRDQVNGWMAAAGFHPVQEFNLFPGKKWFVIYGN